ncbi:MAG: ferredoxin--NADP+ reductase [Planctomycetota bacterium]|jgi:ferredoxin--NADP+ reductase
MPTKEMQTNAQVTKTIEVHSELVILKIAPDGWEFEEFSAGQFAVLGLPGKAPRCKNSDPDVQPVDEDKLIRRAYSIGSAPSEKKELEFYISLVASGGLSPRLLGLKEGDPIFLATKPKGTFTLDDVPEEQNLVLMSTGTGITPYLSMVRGSALDSGRKVAILQGVRHSWDLGYNSELTALQEQHSNLSYRAIVSRPQLEKTPWPGHTGHVQNLWASENPKEILGFEPNPENTHIYLCGNPAMIKSAQEMLEGQGYSLHSKSKPGNIHVEKYW